MATKIQQILEANPDSKILFSEWLTSHGLDAKEQYAYMKRGWLTRLSLDLILLWNFVVTRIIYPWVNLRHFYLLEQKIDSRCGY